MMKGFLAILLSSFLLFTLAGQAWAQQDSSMKTVFQDAGFGGLAGLLVGGALLVFTDEPGDHLDYLAYGAAVGVLAGAAFGIFSVSRPLFLVEQGGLRWQMPLLKAEMEQPAKGVSQVRYSLTLMEYRF